MKINSFAMARTTFFSKTLKTLARFSPRRVVFGSVRRWFPSVPTWITLVDCAETFLKASWEISVWKMRIWWIESQPRFCQSIERNSHPFSAKILEFRCPVPKISTSKDLLASAPISAICLPVHHLAVSFSFWAPGFWYPKDSWSCPDFQLSRVKTGDISFEIHCFVSVKNGCSWC